jgi:Sec-independent protein secretion pathway component TatC
MSTIVFAVPMLGLYIVSIAIAFIFQKRKRPVSATD